MAPKTCFLFLVAVLFVIPSEATVTYGRILRFVGLSVDVGDFAERLIDFFDLDTQDGNLQTTSQALSRQIGDLIELSKPTILSNLLATSKIDRIYDAVIAMQSSMKDLRYVVVAGGGQQLATYKQQFITNFEQAGVIQQIRFLPELLTYVVPGFDVTLIQQVEEKAQCNIKVIGVFRDFYMNLITNGIALHATYEEFTKNVSLRYLLLTEWVGSLDKVQGDFDSIERECFDELYKRAHSCSSVSTCNCPAAKPCRGSLCTSSGANDVGISRMTIPILMTSVWFMKKCFMPKYV